MTPLENSFPLKGKILKALEMPPSRFVFVSGTGSAHCFSSFLLSSSSSFPALPRSGAGLCFRLCLGTPALGRRSQLALFGTHEVVQELLTVLLKKEEAQPRSDSSIGASQGFNHAHPGAPSSSAGLGAPPHAAALQEVPWSNFERLWPRGERGMPSQPRRWCSDGCAASPSVSSFEE